MAMRVQDPGFRDLILKFGINADIDAAAEEDIWEGGGDYTGFDVSSAAVASLVSSSTADDVGSTGMRTVTVEGLDGNWVRQSVSVNLDGTTPVATTETWRRVWRVFGTAFGSGKTNAGNVTVTVGGNVCAVVQAGFGQTEIACWTVPANYTAYMTGWGFNFTSGANADVDCKLMSLDNARVDPGWLVKEINYATGLSGNYERVYHCPKKFTEKTDIKLRASTDTNNTPFSGHFDIYLVPD